MQYFVTGGTGFIGSRLVEQLAGEGHDVTVLTRDRSNAGDLPESVTITEGDITDKESVRDAMDGADRVFHLAAWFQVGPGPWNTDLAEQINVEGTRNVLELMAELDVEKGVYASTVGVYGNTGGEHVDESYRSPNAFPSVYQETKWRAHYEVAEPMMDDGLPLVVATLGAVYGPGDKDYGGTVRTGFQGYLEQDMPMIPSDFSLPWEHVDDTAANLRRAMEHGDLGEEYIITSESRRLPAVFEMAEDLTGVSTPRAVPGSLFSVMSSALSVVENVTRPPEGFESELMGFFGSGAVLVDTSKAERDLGIEHRPLEEGLRDYLAWEVDQLGMDDQVTLESPRQTA